MRIRGILCKCQLRAVTARIVACRLRTIVLGLWQADSSLAARKRHIRLGCFDSA